jgi:hypothetical protein
MEVEENLNQGLSRSVTITFFDKDAVVAALNVSFNYYNFFLHFINNFFFTFQHPEPVVLNRVSLKISAWHPEDEPDPPECSGAVPRTGSRQ